MTDKRTVVVTLGQGRTFAKLQKNTNAVYMIIKRGPMEPGEGILKWKGIRVYLGMKEVITSGPKLDIYKSEVAEILGKQAADMIKVLTTFEALR
jgi:hypothetical protein